MGRVDLRLHPETRVFDGTPSGRPGSGVVPARDGEPVDTVALVLAVDAFPPTVFNARLPVAWTPTVSSPRTSAPAPRRGGCGRVHDPFVTGGFLEEDGVLWDVTGPSSPRADSWP